MLVFKNKYLTKFYFLLNFILNFVLALTRELETAVTKEKAVD